MAEFCVTILRSHFNGKVGKKLDLIHYAIQIDGEGIFEFGRYDGTDKLRHRGSRHADEEVVTAFKVHAPITKAEVIAYIQSITKGKKWTYLGTNCVNTARAVVNKYGPSQSQNLVSDGENNFNRVFKYVAEEAIAW